MIEHFKAMHEGPLIQYFKPTVTLTLSHIKTFNENSCCIINYDSNVFFLNMCTAWNFYLLFWIWCAGDEKKAAQYEYTVNVKSETDVFLNVVSSVFSMKNVTWDEIKTERRGVFLNEKIFKTLTNVPESKLNISVSIRKKF